MVRRPLCRCGDVGHGPGQTAGLSGEKEQANEVIDYIRSRSAPAALNRGGAVATMYGRAPRGRRQGKGAKGAQRAGRLSQQRGADRSGYDNAHFIARIYGRNYRDIQDFIEDFTELGRQLAMPVKTYSSGMRARLAFALSLTIEFDCYLIDEAIALYSNL